MHRFVLVVAAACSSPPATPPPANSKAAKPDVSAAPLIVRGRATITDTRAGQIGNLTVDTILQGAAPPSVPFISAPGIIVSRNGITSDAAIYFLTPEGDRFRVLGRVDASDENNLVAQLAATCEAPIGYKAELAIFRAGAAKPWTPASQPAIDAAATVFSKICWIGMTEATVTAALGKPDEIKGDRWDYVRHNGEMGVIRSLRFVGGKVRAVEITLTQ
jgi:hypothetical protein